MPIRSEAGARCMLGRAFVWACLVVLLAPGAAGAWMSKGSWEPDTARDRLDGWMRATPDVVAITGQTQAGNLHRVYFNGFHGDIVGSTTLNLGTVHSSIYQSASFAFYAMLGVWKDCNRDGYVGNGEQGMLEYRSELLLDASVCKAQVIPSAPPSGKPPTDWFPVHNDGKWVREWISISWYPYNTQSFAGEANPYDLNDNASRVWADFGRPGEAQPASFACPIQSQPKGTYHSTGGFLEWADCWFGNRGTETANDALFLANADNLGLGRVSFSDKEDDQRNSTSILNQKNPWGDSEDKPYWTMWDCNSNLVSQSIPTPLANPIVIRVPNPIVPSSIDPSGSPGGFLNESYKARDCDRSERSAQGNIIVPGQAIYALESDTELAPPKTRSAATLHPNFGTRPAAPFSPVLGPSSPPGPGTGDPFGDFGASIAANEGIWSETLTTRHFEVPLINSRLDTQSSWYNTYYAFVSATAIAKYGLTLPKGSAVAAYGSEACGTNIAGIHKGWDCNKNNWWKSGTADEEPRSTTLASGQGAPIGARPGSPYNMRDVDCYDQSMDNLRGSAFSLGAVTGQDCLR